MKVTSKAITAFLFLLTAYMIYADKDNWGWVLVLAILSSENDE